MRCAALRCAMRGECQRVSESHSYSSSDQAYFHSPRNTTNRGAAYGDDDDETP